LDFLDLLQRYAGVGAMLVSGALMLLATKFVTREQNTKDDAEIKASVIAVGTKVEVLEDRVSKIEGEMQHLPDKEITHRLELNLVLMQGELKAMNEKLRPVAATMERMQDLLMERQK
jgi:Protein of unknown function (DUF2730)